MTFTDEEKIIVFDKIAELYYEKNFGSTCKKPNKNYNKYDNDI